MSVSKMNNYVSQWWLSCLRIRLKCGRPEFDPWVGKIPWRRKLQPTPVYLPGESHGQRRLAGYCPWGRKSRTRFSDLVTPPPPCWIGVGSSVNMTGVFMRRTKRTQIHTQQFRQSLNWCIFKRQAYQGFLGPTRRWRRQGRILP